MNVQEILQIKSQRKNRNKLSINKIVDNIHKKIKYYANLNKESCSYTVPPILDDMPLFDLDNIIKEIFKILDSEGYIVSAFSTGQIDICWNEKLVEQKVKTDAYILSSQERKLRNVTKKSKQIDERFSFLANPNKVINGELTLEEKLDQQVDKILKQKEKEQKSLSKRIGNFSKI